LAGEWLTPFALVHNVVLVILSLVMGIGVVQGALERASSRGWFSLICGDIAGRELLRGKIGFWIYVYYVSKYYELIDTLILLLKAKPVIPLHIYHHAMMVFGGWAWNYYGWLEGSWWCVFVNSVIHFFMYIYYTLAILKIDVWWKKHLTSLQIFQFMTGWFYVNIYLYYYFGNLHIVWENDLPRFEYEQGCFGHLGCALMAHAVNCTFIVLFIRFFLRTYKKSGVKTD